MIAEASIHESVLKQVAIGMPCTLTIDALPGPTFTGKVQYVALLPDKGSWWANPNQRLYKTEISVDEVHADMRPGMSCSVEILTEDIADALYVPLQAVLFDGSETIAFVSKGEQHERRTVKIGRSNDKWVEVLAGLVEGEEVLLSPPQDFKLQQDKDKSLTGTSPGGAKEQPAAGMAANANGVDKSAPAVVAPGSERMPQGERPRGNGEHRGNGERGKRPPAGSATGDAARGGGGQTAVHDGAASEPAAKSGGADAVTPSTDPASNAGAQTTPARGRE
jgi:HlyD family secretion protein